MWLAKIRLHCADERRWRGKADRCDQILSYEHMLRMCTLHSHLLLSHLSPRQPYQLCRSDTRRNCNVVPLILHKSGKEMNPPPIGIRIDLAVSLTEPEAARWQRQPAAVEVLQKAFSASSFKSRRTQRRSEDSSEG